MSNLGCLDKADPEGLESLLGSSHKFSDLLLVRNDQVAYV